MYTLYVIPGSHACRSAMLMLEHKQVPYRRVDIVTLLHPLVTRLHGFDAGGQTRTAGGLRTFGLRLSDRLGTVPALAANGRRISTNHGIARFLDERHPQPPIFPRILRGVFAAGPAAERELLAELPPMLDRIDAWIADGVLGGVQLNAADFMVAPSLALILYRPDVMPMFEGRPALELVDRLLPEPA